MKRESSYWGRNWLELKTGDALLVRISENLPVLFCKTRRDECSSTLDKHAAVHNQSVQRLIRAAVVLEDVLKVFEFWLRHLGPVSLIPPCSHCLTVRHADAKGQGGR